MPRFTPEIDQRVRASFSRSKLMRLYGAAITALHTGYIELEVPAKEDLLRPSGTFHGGVLAALADTAGGYAAAAAKTEDPYFVTVELKINFLRQAKGEKLLVKGKVIKDGRTLSVCQVDIYAVGTTKTSHAAMATLTMMRIEKP